MKVRRAKKGEMFRCGVGHYWPEALLVEGQDPPHLNGTYCLVCFGARIVGRLAIPRTDAVADPFEPAEAEPEQEEAVASEDPTIEERAAEVAVAGADVAGDESAESGEPTGPSLGEPRDAEGQGIGEEPAE